MSNSLLLVALLLLALVQPFFPAESFGQAAFGVTMSAVLIAALWAVSRHRGVLVLSRRRLARRAHAHRASARKAGITEAMLGELMAVVGMASETNALADFYQIPVDERFQV